MIDEEHEIIYQDHEILEEVEPIKSTNCIIIINNSDEPKRKKQKGEFRHPRQKFCPMWQIEFPWLRPNRLDDSLGYCSICKSELVCKRSFLDRHQRTFKHRRLQAFENVNTVNEPEAELIAAHISGYLDNDHDYQFEEHIEDDDDGYTTIKTEPTKISDSTPIFVRTRLEPKNAPKKPSTPKNKTRRQSSPTVNVERDLHNRSIMGERHDTNMSDFCYRTPAQPKKDSFDVFFESISATVKTLPPKLSSEVKSRVSQVLAEFELRAICEKEAQLDVNFVEN